MTDRWRDVQNVEHVLGKYLISDHPMTVEQWAAERATVVNEVIDDSATPALPAGTSNARKARKQRTSSLSTHYH